MAHNNRKNGTMMIESCENKKWNFRRFLVNFGGGGENLGSGSTQNILISMVYVISSQQQKEFFDVPLLVILNTISFFTKRGMLLNLFTFVLIFTSGFLLFKEASIEGQPAWIVLPPF